MKLTIQILSLVLLTSCFKTAEQVKREQKLETIDRQFQDSRTLVAEVTLAIKDLQRKVDTLSGDIEEIRHHQKQYSPEDFKSLQESVSLMKEQLEVLKNDNEQLRQEMSGLKDVKKSDSKKNDKKSLQSALDDISQLMKNKQFTKARQALDELLTQNHSAAETNRIYHQYGELELKAKQPEKALVYFSKIYTKYPQSSLAPSSLYHIGLSFKNMGKKEEASEAFAELKEKFPKSPLVKKINDI